MKSKSKASKMMESENEHEIAEKRWIAVLPAEVEKETDCVLFLARMTYIAFAEYLFNRNIIRTTAFKKRRLIDGSSFHLFSNNSRYGTKLTNVMRGIMEAIKEKYARQAMIVIGEDRNNPDLATEIFCITYGYNQEDCFKITDEHGNVMLSLGYSSKEEFRLQVTEMISTITRVAASLKHFNGEALPAIKMTYYEERTPPDYEPAYFKRCDRTYDFEGDVPNKHIGSISTSHGGMAFELKSHYMDPNRTIEDLLNEQIPMSQGSGESTFDDDWQSRFGSTPGRANRSFSRSITPADHPLFSGYQEVPRAGRTTPLHSRSVTPVVRPVIEEEQNVAEHLKVSKNRSVTPANRPTIEDEENVAERLKVSKNQSFSTTSSENGSVDGSTKKRKGAVEIQEEVPAKSSVTIRHILKSPDDYFARYGSHQ